MTNPEAWVDRDGEARADQRSAAQAGQAGEARAELDGAGRAGQDSAAQIIEGFARLSESTLPSRMGITVTDASAERVTGTMPVDGNVQPYGLLHGGASCVLAETLGSLGAALHAARAHGGIAVGIEINATHHKAARRGVVTGVATPLRLGTSIASYEIVISDEAGERICTARLTCALRRR